jgi:hypothetical protein
MSDPRLDEAEQLSSHPECTSDVAAAYIARRYTKKALAALVLAIEAPEVLPTDVLRIRVQAAQLLLERAYGRPPQANAIPSVISPDDLERMIRDARERCPDGDDA